MFFEQFKVLYNGKLLLLCYLLLLLLLLLLFYGLDSGLTGLSLGWSSLVVRHGMGNWRHGMWMRLQAQRLGGEGNRMDSDSSYST